MLFTSFTFLIFLIIVLSIYWLVLSGHRRLQNLFLLFASYVFYGWLEPGFLLLLIFTGIFAFLAGKWIGLAPEESPQRKYRLWAGVAVHLGLLGYFKYTNFLLSSWAGIVQITGAHWTFSPLNILLPLGISFYTFHALSYLMDVHSGTIDPADDFLDFMAHISFFPQIESGPIERTGHLLPQFQHNRTFDKEKIFDGLRQILWGVFKKVAIADSLAQSVNYVFLKYPHLQGGTILLGTIFYSFQLYCDFSGYSDMAIGIGRLFGFELLKNFNFPFFSTTISEFWRKWHISLTHWILDYIYTPIAIRKRGWGKWGIIYAVVIAFTLSGLWHGAAWTFIIWGLLHGMAMGYEVLTKKQRKRFSHHWNPVLYSGLSMVLVFIFWTFTLTIFRSENIVVAGQMICTIFSHWSWSLPQISLQPLWWALGLLIMEWIMRDKDHGLQIAGWPYYLRWVMYAGLIMLIFSTDNLNNQTGFLYFKF